MILIFYSSRKMKNFQFVIFNCEFKLFKKRENNTVTTK